MPRRPVEHAYAIHYSGIDCETKKEAIKIANDIAAKVNSLVERNALCIVVLSNVDRKTATVMVNSQNHKILEPKQGKKVRIVRWHIHISLLASPGDTTKNDIHKYLRETYPCKTTYVKIVPDRGGCGKTTEDEVRYALEQGVIVRTVAVGDVNRLAFKDTYQGFVREISKELGYGGLKITIY